VNLRRIARAACAFVLLAAAHPAAALDVAREDVRAFIDEVVAHEGLARDWVTAIVAAAEIRQGVIDAASHPAERVHPWFEYRALMVSSQRIADGRAFYAAHRPLLEAIATRTGVPGELISAIVGIESSYGRQSGHWRVLDSLATLAFEFPARSSFFRGELEQFLLLAQRAGFDPLKVTGSYAGAMGAPQFIPRAYLEFARDGDGDGRIDLWNDWPDIFESVAHYFIAHGWRRGEPICVSADLWDPDVEDLPSGRLEPNATVAALRAKGVLFTTTLPADAPAVFVAVREVNGPAYRVGFHNFWVVTRYNSSALYALAVAELATALAPEPETAAP
jgi:peptidoglycan lytic transglycosylase B